MRCPRTWRESCCCWQNRECERTAASVMFLPSPEARRAAHLEGQQMPYSTHLRQCAAGRAIKNNTRNGATHVRFGSEAEICSAKRDVRFGPKADIGSKTLRV